MLRTLQILLCGGALTLLTLPAMAQTTKTAPTPADTTAAPAAAKAAPTKTFPAAEHYEGGQAALYEFIGKNLNYPPTAKRNRIQGQCIIGFTLNDDGSMSNVAVVKNIGGGCGEEALRVVKMLKFKPPGYSIKTSLPVVFKL